MRRSPKPSARAVVLVLCLAGGAWAHDVSLDVSGATTAPSENNPRSGSFGGTVAGSFDFTDAWAAWAGFTYTRDLGTSTPEATSAGSNIFLVTAGALFMPSEHFSFLLSGHYSPSVTQENATAVTFGQLLGRPQTVDLTVRSVTASGGANLTASWLSGGLSDFEHLVDVSVGFTSFNAYQLLQVPATTAGARWRAYCQTPVASGQRLCPLVNGVSTPLTQVRLGATYTANLFSKFDLGLDGAYFVYTADPNEVGYFSVLQLGRSPDWGNGVPVAPYLFTAKVFALYRFSRLTLKLSYQFGEYTGASGANHLLALRASYRFNHAWKVTTTVSGQGDAAAAGFVNLGLQATAGVLYTFE